MTLPGLETHNGIAFGRCAVCRRRTTVERGGRRCWVCEHRMPPNRRKAVLLLVLAAQGERW